MTLGVRDGLAQSRVNAILVDSQGYVWFATWEGASRFDGRRWVGFGTPQGLPNPLVWCLAEGPGGVIWMGTHGGGLARVADEGIAVLAEPIGPRNPASHVFQIAFDGAGGMWVASDRGLLRSASARPAELAFEAPAGLGEGWLALPPLDANDDLLLVSAHGLARWREGQLELWGLPGAREDIEPGELRSLATRRGGLYAVHARALFELGLPVGPGDGPTRRSVAFDLPPGATFYDVCEDQDGRLWVATSAGLARVDGAGARWFTAADGLPDGWVRALAADPRGGLWIGTHQGGAAYLPSSGAELFTSRSGLGDGHAVALTALEAGRWLVATEAVGLYELGNGRPRLVPGSDRPPFQSLQRNLARDGQGRWWLGTDAGLYRAPAGALDLERARALGPEAGLPPGSARVLGLDPADRAVVACEDGRIFLSAAGGECLAALPFTLPSGIARDVAFLPDGSVWVGDARSLWRWRGEHLERLDAGPGLGPEPQPRRLLVDSRGALWMGTRFAGLARAVEPGAEEPRFERFTTRDGLASDGVFALLEEPGGTLLAGTHRGLQRLWPQERRLETIAELGELASGWIHDLALDGRGSLWVATANGVARVPLSPRRPPKPLPEVRFTRCSLAGRDLSLPAAGARELPLLSIAESESLLEVEYVAVDPLRGAELRYQTRLEGLGRAWSPPTRALEARYGRLPAGRYRLEVRCVAAEGGPPSEPARLTLEVLPPPWKRPGFLALALLAASGAAFGLHRARLARGLALERLRTRIAADLHDEVGAGLARIAISSEHARRAGLEEGQELMGEVAELARGLRGSMGEVLWAIDPRQDSLVLLVHRLRSFALDLLGDGGRELELRLPEERELERLHLSPDRRRHLTRIFQEALVNVARHARAGRVEVELGLGGGRMRLRVRDDGVGFDPALARGGQGLESLRRRARELGGELHVDSAPGRGSSLSFEAPLRASRSRTRRRGEP